MSISEIKMMKDVCHTPRKKSIINARLHYLEFKISAAYGLISKVLHIFKLYKYIFNEIARSWFLIWRIFSNASAAWIIDWTRVFDAWESTFTFEPNWMFLDLFYWLQICSKHGEFSHKNIQLKVMKRLWGHLRKNYWLDHDDPYFNH